ncbi:MAG: hypothetical protein ACREVN_08025 [Gammaproteobacteria bacterium]
MKAAALVFLVITCLPGCATPGREDRPAVTDSILGLKVGDTLAAARERLDPLGTTAGRATREGGRKQGWQLEETPFRWIALKTNDEDRVKWISGALRPGREIPFAELGDLSLASRATAAEVIWNVPASSHDYRLVGKGRDGHAAIVYLLSLDVPPQ